MNIKLHLDNINQSHWK